MLTLLQSRCESIRTALTRIEALAARADGHPELDLQQAGVDVAAVVNKVMKKLQREAALLTKALASADNPSTRPGLFDGQVAEPVNGQAPADDGKAAKKPRRPKE